MDLEGTLNQTPIVKFQTNIPVMVTFPFGDFKPVDGNYGTQYRYNVDVDGVRSTIFASNTLHEKLLNLGDLKGQTIRICKVELPGGKSGWQVGEESQQAPQQAPKQAYKPQPAPTGSVTEAQIFAAAERCLREADKQFNAIFGGEDQHYGEAHAEFVRAWGASLFIAVTSDRTIVRSSEVTSDDGLPF